MAFFQRLQNLLNTSRAVDWLGPLALRLYLAPIFYVAGMNKVNGFENTVAWFGNPEWGLGLPFPAVMAGLATGTEVIGALFLLIGLATRWACIPLMATMLVAAFSAHWKNGWQAIADPMSPWVPADIDGTIQRLDKAKDILREHGNYSWLTENGNFVVSNSGIEWAATYFIMLLILFFVGAGRYLSIDYWIAERLAKQS